MTNKAINSIYYILAAIFIFSIGQLTKDHHTGSGLALAAMIGMIIYIGDKIKHDEIEDKKTTNKY